jgi:hypothetical protein
MATDGRYWSIEHCGWVASPSAGDALATPWSAHGLPAPVAGPTPRDGLDLLRARPRSGRLPGQRADAGPARPAEAPEPTEAPGAARG